MIFLSLLCKSLALALLRLHPWLAAGMWALGLALDIRITRGQERVASRLALLHGCALTVGWAVALGCDHAAMRWKDGVPVIAALVDAVLGLCGVSSAHHAGEVHLTMMAGPLRFAVSPDLLGMKTPLVFLALCGVWLLWTETPVREAVRRWLLVMALLLLAAVARAAAFILLASGLFEFVGYESEELPYRPFMDEAFGIWFHLPFLLAVAVIVGKLLPLPHAAPAMAEQPRWFRFGAPALLLVLAAVIAWQPLGKPKNGKLVISTHHTQWSRCDRAYDREWYGAESGYNYACMRRLFGYFMPVEVAAGPLTASVLDGAGVLVIYDPDRPYSAEETAVIHEFVRGGGGLLLIGDHTNVFGSASHLNPLCAPFGFQFRDDVLFDLDEDFHQLIDAPRPAPSLWHGMSFFKLRGPASIRPTSLWTRPVYQVGRSKSVRAIYSVNNFYPPPHDDPAMKFGTFCVSATARHGKGRVAAWGDSTVFSNFEIFYPGKAEYLVNTMHWLNHSDGVLHSVARRMALLGLAGGLLAVLLWRRQPRVWLGALSLTAAALLAARYGCGWIEGKRSVFPQPVTPSEWVVFAAQTDDKAHHLRDFITEEPYDQRYEVFIQWVLRTGAFAGYHLLDDDAGNAFQRHLRTTPSAKVASAWIVRKPEDIDQLDEVAAIPLRPDEPVLLMFSSKIPQDKALEAIRKSGLAGDENALARCAGAWPSGEVLLETNGRRVLVVAGAERFSDQSMGITEKVVPDDAQRAVFNQAYGLIDRLFGRDAANP
jgi:hypothetical protein